MSRPPRQQRGYDRKYDRTRRQWAPKVATGTVDCWRCGQPIAVTDEWHLGHDDHDRTIIRGPEHARRCNLAAAGRAAHAKRAPRRRPAAPHPALATTPRG